MTLTADSLLAQLNHIQRAAPAMLLIYSVNALEATEERLFPFSKNRSRRIHKKLVRRFGGEFRMRPCIFKVNNTLIAHPSFRAEIERVTVKVQQSAITGLFGP